MNQQRRYGYTNIYVCEKCGGNTVTIDVDEGVTPFMLGCRAAGDEFTCDGMARSSFYRVPADTPDAEWEWFRSTGSEYRKLSRAMRDHVNKGGLDLRKKAPAVGGDPAGYYRDSRGSLRKVAPVIMVGLLCFGWLCAPASAQMRDWSTRQLDNQRSGWNDKEQR